jgi:hypothetical protein
VAQATQITQFAYLSRPIGKRLLFCFGGEPRLTV